MTPFVTWGTNPGQGVPLGGAVPTPTTSTTPSDRIAAEKALEYMGLEAGTPMREIKVDTVFVGSCTNGRIEDLRLAAEIIKGRKVADDTRLLVVPGSVRVRLQAEDEGLDMIFKEAGAEWRGAGCSMCLGMNPDQLAPRERSASTSNRNFEGRQGKGGRTHLVSVPVAAATAVRGTLSSPADLRARSLAEEPDMDKFTTHTGVGVPLRRSNVDTDQIIPAVYLKRVTRTGFEDGLFAAWRDDPTFVLNNAGVRRGHRCSSPVPTSAPAPRASTPSGPCRTTASGPSSRSRFADIFRGNSGKAGLRRRAGRREGRAAALGPTSRTTPARRSPSTWRRERSRLVRVLTRSRTPSTSTTTRGGGCSRGSTTSASRWRHDDDIAAFEAGRPSWKPATL